MDRFCVVFSLIKNETSEMVSGGVRGRGWYRVMTGLEMETRPPCSMIGGV